MAETLLIVSLILINISLTILYLVQRHSLIKAQGFLNEFIENSQAIVNAVEKCIGIINKNAELLLHTAEKTENLEDELVRLKAVYSIIKDYFSAIETINEARRVEMPLSKRVYQLTSEEESK
jgi:uncharacterized protein YoxC